jgi:hypothetical protein
MKARDDPNFSIYDDHDIIVTAYSMIHNASKKHIDADKLESGHKIRIG